MEQRSLNRTAAAATLHCLTGCSIGEIVGLVVGTVAGLSNATTIAVSVGLAFVFGYTISSLPLLKAGLPIPRVARVVLVSDTVSILTMEIVDNVGEAIIPGALTATLTDSTFWWSMLVSLAIAYAAAYPVNRALLRRGRGHAVTHSAYADAPDVSASWRRFLPAPPPATTAAAVTAFVLGAWLASGAGAIT